MGKAPTEFRTSFTITCACGKELHGTISTTGFRYMPVTRVDDVLIDFSKAKTSVHYENELTHCSECGKALPTKPVQQKGDNEDMGKPSKGTKADGRLKENKPKPAIAKPVAPAPVKKGK